MVEFEKLQHSKSLHDVALAPPTLLKKPGSKATVQAANLTSAIPESQRKALEVEREKVIAQYRAIKQRRAAARAPT